VRARPGLRIALVAPQSSGGIAAHVRMLAVALARAGHDVCVCAPDATLERLDLDLQPVAAVPAGVGSLAGLPALRRLVRDYDVVHAHGVRAAAQVALAATAVRQRAALIATWHNAPIGSWSRRRLHAGLEAVGARGSDAVLVASEDLLERARRAGARHVVLCPVVAPAVTPAPDGEPDRDSSPPLVLAVARLAAQKRLDLLVEATAGWAGRPDAPRVVVAGDGPLREELTALARRAGSPLEVLGARTDVPALLRAATVLVLCSEWEARPLAVQEAMRAGVPVVATAVGGVPGLVRDAAVLVPPGDAGALRAALTDLLADADRRERLRQAGLAQAATWPTVEEMVACIRQAYLEVSSRVRRPPAQ
jgi:glycosyltransferase involved in cell wall biosynthesis